MPYGTLPKAPEIPRIFDHFKIPLREDLPTRWEEFTFVRDELRTRKPGLLLDAACGFEPGVHIFPEIASLDGWTVEAVDLKVPMPPLASTVEIHRVVADTSNLPYEDNIFDAVVTISAVEHMNESTRERTFLEMWRTAKPGALVVITMDNVNPKPYVEQFADKFDFGKFMPLGGEPTQPNVTFLSGVVLK